MSENMTEEKGKIRRRITVRDDVHQELSKAAKEWGDTPNRIAQDAFKWYLKQFAKVE